jgi:mono/diheme cytochrome c family protein
VKQLCLATCGLLAVLASGCDLPGRPKPGDRPVPADEVTDFGTLYAMRCAGCHGADGKLGPAPPFNDALFLAIVPDAELLRVITEGRVVTPGQKSPMPAFARSRGGPLTEAQVKVLAGGIKTRWGPPAAGSPPPYLAPAGSAGKKDQGVRLFDQGCAACHGARGKGGNDGDRQLLAINDQAFLALISDQELRRIIITGRPDLGMPPYNINEGRAPGFRPLTSADIDDLVALLAYWRQGGSPNGE